jgi:lycopene beta-cyclase
MAGGGAAGLSLAYYLSKSGLSNKRVLIIDKDRKNKNDRTWGFWHNTPTPFEEIVSSRFYRLHFYSSYFQKNIALQDYQYSVIQGIDFYRFIKNQLKPYPNFEFLNTQVSGFNEKDDGVEVITDQGNYQGNLAFSSIFDEQEIVKATKSKLYLRQHFKGWIIKTENDCFDKEAFTMFDFRTEQNGLMRFFYVIPQSKNQALVEYTLFSENLLQPERYDEAIEKYIDEILRISNYEIVETEFGVIPMTDYKFPSRQGKYVINIGSLGGSSKPSSGYTFTRIQKHTKAIADALEKGISPDISANSGFRYRFYDSVLLNILKTRGGMAEKLFSYMFKNNSITQLFNFLDEDGGLVNDLKIISSLPPMPFLKSTAQLLFSK